MVDRQFRDVRMAELYDPRCGREGRADSAFYLPMVMAADAVLDVGCGTGALLHLARETGHDGRLVGLDPAAGMLEVAGRREDVEWISGDLTTASWASEFDLVVMTGHAFQVLVGDDEITTSLAAVRRALTDDGVFAFETRNPAAREWERWNGDAVEFTAADGSPGRFDRVLEGPMEGGLVAFTSTYRLGGAAAVLSSRSTLRFVDEPTLDAFLAAAGLAVEWRAGDWDGSPVTTASLELITRARRA